MVRIALDAMGGDYAPKQVVIGAVEAAVGIGDTKVLLVGQQDAIQHELEALPKDLKAKAHSAITNGTLEIIHAPEVAEMDESAAKTIHRKPECSINVAMRLVKDGKADAFVSAGNSGAVAASAMFTLKRIEGVHRPAIAMIIPTKVAHKPLVLLDSGANCDCRPEWLMQWAIMGSVYSQKVFGQKSPVVGLMSIGEEECKGNQLVHDTHAMLKEVKSINFRGNMEGHDVCNGEIDVAVCDGFVGNVVLKTVESVAKAIGTWLKKEITAGWFRKICALMLKGAFKALKRQMDPEMYGGAPLLGVNGTVIITHGNSSHKGIFYAVKAGVAAATNDVSGLIQKSIADNAAEAPSK